MLNYVDSSILSLVWVILGEKNETKKKTFYTKSWMGRENYMELFKHSSNFTYRGSIMFSYRY